MKRLIASAAAAALAWCAAADVAGVVTRVSDGDTIWVTDAARLRHKVRLLDIDAPESSQPFGAESTARLKALVGGRKVRVAGDGHDMYGRVLGVVWLDGEDVNLKMVREGMAWVYRHSANAQYIAAQSSARAARRGLWRAEAPTEPYEWRKQQKGKK
ncbi:MAG: thermonuclease family protein [Oscillibacter sp.]|nr:thermonuclease family protein [Oscillibacter sp.]MBR0057706.1 thermonuclease family protein [Kiritimatiellia bacterium]